MCFRKAFYKRINYELGISDISNPKRPFPRDSENANFKGSDKKFENAFFQIDGMDVTMAKIEDYLKELNHLDKTYNKNSRQQKKKGRKNLFNKGELLAKYTNNARITSMKDFEKFEGTEINNFIIITFI